MKIVHISIYPPKGEKHSKDWGVASYTKNLVTDIPYNPQDSVFVLCNKINGETDSYEEDGVHVIRCFDRKPGFLFQLMREIKKIRPDTVHIQQELSLYGNIITAYLLQWLLVFLRKYLLVVTLHGVVPIAKITKEFVHENNTRLPIWLVKGAFKIIYIPLCFWAKKIIVHERIFQNALIDNYGVVRNKIEVIYHGIEDLHSRDRKNSCEYLGLDPTRDIVLFMGYATGYKWIDLLIEWFSEYSKMNTNTFLVIGAGKHPKLFADESYLQEYARLQEKARLLIHRENYKWIWFIEEKDIVHYYSAADISVYPYTIQMSSSGPMSISIGYNKPFLASDVFRGSIDEDMLLFERNPRAMSEKLDFFFKNRERYSDIIGQMRSERLWDRVGASTYHLYEEQ